MKELKQPVHGGRVWDAAEKLNINVEKIIDFSTNTNPLGPPKQLITTLIKNINTVAYYPDPDYRTLRMELARFYNINEENIIVGNGATELIHLFAQTFISENDRVIIPIPTFEEYQYASQKVSARIIYIKSKNNMHINIDKIISKMNNTKVIFVCNPNNPTGILEKQEDILNLIKEANKRNVLVFLDESFMDLVVTKKPYTLIRSVNMFDNLFIIRSLTKIFSIPGLRIGFGVSSKYLIKELNKHKIPWNVSTLIEKTIPEALKYARQYLKTSRKIIKQERNYMISELSKIDGIKVISGDANFLFIDISETGLTSSELADQLIKHRILIRDCSTFTGLNNSYIRIAIKKHRENILLINALKTIVIRK
ncbi:MAG: threonine-phosphate decarboxylase CobD [Thermoprotei archaeon]|jgi:threonine-phosphate decarboxylase